jgi:hypothetical protein
VLKDEHKFAFKARSATAVLTRTSVWRSVATPDAPNRFRPKKTPTSAARGRRRRSAAPAKARAAITTAGSIHFKLIHR